MKKRSSIFCIFVLIIISLVNINYLAASNRGFKLTVKTPKGNRIDLYRDSYALIIGNSNYTNGWDPIEGAIRDVEELAKVLENHGFNIILKTDLTRQDFSRAMSEFSLKFGKDEDNRLLFYYAGHGYTRKLATGDELGYLVMVNAPLPEKDLIGFSINSVDMQSLVTQAKIIHARHVLFMFDSCFSGSIIDMRERVVPRSISDNIKYPVRQFITAGRANEPVPDHSVFKQAFLDLIEGRDEEPIPDNYVTGEELGLYLKTKVPEYNPNQHPQYGKIRDPRLDKGDFVFALKLPVESGQSDGQQSDIEAEKKQLADESELTERKRSELEEINALIEKKKMLVAEVRRLEMEKKTFEENKRKEIGTQTIVDEKQKLTSIPKKVQAKKTVEKSKRKELKTQTQRNEKQKLAYIPKEVQVPKVTLRTNPIMLLEKDIIKMLEKYSFFDRERQPFGNFVNDLTVKQEGTITDRVTGLMWQKMGSTRSLSRRQATSYLKKLNKERLAGYSDWRLPTIEELASLLVFSKINGLHINTLFDSKQNKCWSADSIDKDKVDPSYLGGYTSGRFYQLDWIINFVKGHITYARWIRTHSSYGGDIKYNYNFVRAVRSLK